MADEYTYIGVILIGWLGITSIISLIHFPSGVLLFGLSVPVCIGYVLIYMYPIIYPVINDYFESEKSFDDITFDTYSAVYNNPNTTNSRSHKTYDSGTIGSDFTRTRTRTNSNPNSHNSNQSTHKTSQKQNSKRTQSKIKQAENILEISRPYTQQELKSAYRSKVKDTHPDKPSGSEDQFKNVRKSYELLLDHEIYSNK